MGKVDPVGVDKTRLSGPVHYCGLLPASSQARAGCQDELHRADVRWEQGRQRRSCCISQQQWQHVRNRHTVWRPCVASADQLLSFCFYWRISSAEPEAGSVERTARSALAIHSCEAREPAWRTSPPHRLACRHLPAWRKCLHFWQLTRHSPNLGVPPR